MARPHSTYRTLAALVLLGVAVVVMALMGRWQLARADERLALSDAIEAGRQSAPVRLTAAMAGTDPALTAWQPAEAHGVWLADKTVLLENRNHDGRPGYWIATPMVLDEAGPAPRPAVLVLRGWMPRSLTAAGHPTPPPPSAPRQTVKGELALHVPRLFELGGGQYSRLPDRLGAAGQAVPAVQNLALDAYARAAGLTMVPAVLQQIEPADDGLVHDWPQPSIDYNQNRGYAIQWFAFAAIAAGAFIVVLYRAWRRRAGASGPV